MHGAGCKGATRPMEERGGATHTLLTHIEIKREEALRKKRDREKQRETHGGHSSPCTSQEGKFLPVCPAQQPVTSVPVGSAASAGP